MFFVSHSDEETKKIASELTASWEAGTVITLSGDLGAGKTTFTKGVAQVLGITKEITSPTFAIMNVYETTHPTIKKLVHIDTYRLKSNEELIGIGAEDFVGAPDTLTIIEWPELAAPLLAGKNLVNITLAHTNEGERTITVHETKIDTP